MVKRRRRTLPKAKRFSWMRVLSVCALYYRILFMTLIQPLIDTIFLHSDFSGAAASASSSATSGAPGITSKGFQFLLMGTRAQLWFFLLRFLYHHKVRVHTRNLFAALHKCSFSDLNILSAEQRLRHDAHSESALSAELLSHRPGAF